MKNARLSVLLVTALLLAALSGCIVEQRSPGDLSVDAAALTARVADGTAAVLVPLRPSDQMRFKATAEVWIRDLAGREIGHGEARATLTGDVQAVEVAVPGLPAGLSVEALVD